MPKDDVEKVTADAVAKGGVLVRFYFDMQHEEKDKLQPLLVNLVNDHLMKEAGVVYCYGAIEDPLEKDGVFITSGTITVLFDNFKPILGVAFRYAPAGIEILRPEKEMRFKVNELQSMLMDISQISVGYSSFILEKVLKKEDADNIRRQLENRSELGKRFMGEGGTEEAKK